MPARNTCPHFCLCSRYCGSGRNIMACRFSNLSRSSEMRSCCCSSSSSSVLCCRTISSSASARLVSISICRALSFWSHFSFMFASISRRRTCTALFSTVRWLDFIVSPFFTTVVLAVWMRIAPPAALPRSSSRVCCSCCPSRMSGSSFLPISVSYFSRTSFTRFSSFCTRMSR